MEGESFLEKELSYTLVGCFYTVRNMYGSGHREKFYDAVLGEELHEKKLLYKDKPRVSLHSIQTGAVISFVIPDKVVANKIIVEIKAKPFLTQEDSAQVREYLRITQYEILYLVNFGEKEFKPLRYIYTNDRKPFLLRC